MNKNSSKYTEVEYWNERYSQEEEFDWLQQGMFRV